MKIAIVTSMLSALLGEPPAAKTCMTGEITLHGKVLPIGGLKEKVLAIQREGMRKVILPEKNRPHFAMLDAHVRKGVDVTFVKTYAEAFAVLFADRTKTALQPEDEFVFDHDSQEHSLAS